MGKINSREKGKRGERMWRDVLVEAGLRARRGAQFSGSNESPDVICKDLSAFHAEVKFQEKTAFHSWMEQAIHDGGTSKVPYVAWKKSGKDWLVVLRAEDFIKLAVHFQKEDHEDAGAVSGG